MEARTCFYRRMTLKWIGDRMQGIDRSALGKGRRLKLEQVQAFLKASEELRLESKTEGDLRVGDADLVEHEYTS